jgi:acylpyruvate hydrolase
VSGIAMHYFYLQKTPKTQIILMKIIAIGRNYADHIAELQNERPSEPVIFSKPDTALLSNNDDFYYPTFSNDIHYEVEIVVKISKMGKNIEKKYAHKYYNEIGIGVDFTARDVQARLKEKGLPWEKAKAFNGSAPVSGFVPKSNYKNINSLEFSLHKNGQIVQQGNTNLMLWNIDEIIEHISQYFTLKVGDLVFTGTPSGVGAVAIGDTLEAYIQSQKMLTVAIK